MKTTKKYLIFTCVILLMSSSYGYAQKTEPEKIEKEIINNDTVLRIENTKSVRIFVRNSKTEKVMIPQNYNAEHGGYAIINYINSNNGQAKRAELWRTFTNYVNKSEFIKAYQSTSPEDWHYIGVQITLKKDGEIADIKLYLYNPYKNCICAKDFFQFLSYAKSNIKFNKLPDECRSLETVDYFIGPMDFADAYNKLKKEH